MTRGTAKADPLAVLPSMVRIAMSEDGGFQPDTRWVPTRPSKTGNKLRTTWPPIRVPNTIGLCREDFQGNTLAGWQGPLDPGQRHAKAQRAMQPTRRDFLCQITQVIKKKARCSGQDYSYTMLWEMGILILPKTEDVKSCLDQSDWLRKRGVKSRPTWLAGPWKKLSSRLASALSREGKFCPPARLAEYSNWLPHSLVWFHFPRVRVVEWDCLWPSAIACRYSFSSGRFGLSYLEVRQECA